MNIELKQDFNKEVIQNLLDVFVTPEVKRRQDAGMLPKPLELRYAQVILFPDERKPLIRINEEVKAKAKVKFHSGISKKLGDLIYEHEIEAIEHVELGPNDDPDCRYIFLYFKGKKSIAWFDFRRNKALAAKHIDRAKEYVSTAHDCLQGKRLVPFVDNLFDAAELSAKAVLLAMHDYSPTLRKKSTHSAIQLRYNRFANLGNVIPKYKSTFNRLTGLRTSARYLKGAPLKLADEETREMLDTVNKMISDTAERLKGFDDMI